MRSRGSGKSYLVSRSVEEPLEATFELGEDISEFSEKLRVPVVLGMIGSIILLLVMLPRILYLADLVYDIYYNELEVTASIMILATIMGLWVVLLLSFIITTLVYLFQVNSFKTHLSLRYSLVSGLQHAQPAQARSGYNEKRPGHNDDKIMNEIGTKKHRENPIFAMLDLVEESMHALPQIVKLVRYCTYFITISIVLLSSLTLFSFIFPQHALFDVNVFEIVSGIAAIVILIPTLKLLIDSEDHFRYLQTRHDIIDSVRFGKNISVPSGKDQLKRLINYLSKNDPYIKSSILAEKGSFDKKVELAGASGGKYTFDVYFNGLNVLRTRSGSIGMPMGRFGVFIKVFKKPITLKKVRAFREALSDVCEKENIFPLRVIALQWVVEELDDEVYEYVLEDPIEMKNTLAHVQVIAEDDEVYSFIPIISYGKEGVA